MSIAQIEMSPDLRRDDLGRMVASDGYPLAGLATMEQTMAFSCLKRARVISLVEQGELEVRRFGRTLRITWASIRRVTGNEPQGIAQPTRFDELRRDDLGRMVAADGYPLAGLAFIDDATAIGAMSRSHIYSMVRNGELEAKRFGRSCRITWASIRQAFLS